MFKNICDNEQNIYCYCAVREKLGTIKTNREAMQKLHRKWMHFDDAIRMSSSNAWNSAEVTTKVFVVWTHIKYLALSAM